MASRKLTVSVELEEHRRSLSWRRREGLDDYEGEIDVETLELLDREQEPNPSGISSIGLTSQQAYTRLFDAIREELEVFDKANTVHWMTDVLNTLKSDHRSPIGWISLGFLLLEVLLMFITSGLSGSGRLHLPVAEGLVILLLTVMNLLLCVREEWLSRTEMSRSTQYLMEQYEAGCSWMPSDYVDPCTPPSPSISLASAYRDNTIVSVPRNLLVQGDVVVLGPSDTAPAQVQRSSGHGSLLVLETGEAFDPPLESKACEECIAGRAEACQPHPREKFLVMETPIKISLRKILHSSRKRPDSILANEMHHITKTVTAKRLLWVVLVTSLIVNVIRTVLMTDDCGEWSEMIMLLQAYVLLPLLPLSFPMVWIVLNLYGVARIKAVFDSLKEGVKVGNPSLREVLVLFWNIVLGDPSTLPRTANLLQTLGNITVWCCVDKEGILSLPNPQAEKVFFLRNKGIERRAGLTRRKQRKESTCTWSSEMSRTSDQDSTLSFSSSSSSEDEFEEILFDEESEFGWSGKGHREVLNLSSDPESQFGLRFDDVRWQEHLTSLKPLGLNILLNSCCSSPVRCLRFADYTGHMSLHHNNLPAPAYRRCLCLLGKEIGFMEQALQLFSKRKFIFAMQPSVTRPSGTFRPHSFLSICKEKVVPNMICLVAREVSTGSLQLLSQGSADLVLDACTDFWDGVNLCPITPHERKKVLDFYQRSSMSAYCVTFAYRPVIENLDSLDSGDAFLELPSVTNWHHGSESEDTASSPEISDAESETADNQAQMSDDVSELVDEAKVDSLLEKVDIAQDVDCYQRILGGQVFIGMVTLQYQAKTDIIPLVEDLNNAGIRFVYFSSENELRSRVFAERMGLETGWNCHISLSTVHWEEQSSTGTVSERNDGSLTDVRVADGEAQETDERNDDEKHVTWMAGVGDLEGQGSKTESKEREVHTGEREPLMDSSQISTNDDLWFFCNRAKLPRGVHNIRPHLEKVDNVPLLVPMFTDCSPLAIREMIGIMQEYGEVVCCVGSSFNVNNTDIFAQADMSIAVEPLFPQLCLKGLPKDFRSGTPQLGGELTSDRLGRKFSGSVESGDPELSPLELSALLNSLPCCLSFHRDVEFKFNRLLQESRRICFGLRVCFTFLLSCQLLLSSVELLSSCFLLPPPLNGLHVLWMSCLTIPLLSLSLIGAPLEGSLMTTLTGKNDNKFKDIMFSFCWYFSLGFLPCAFVCSVVLFPLTLRGFCVKIHNDHTKCHYLLGFRNGSEPWNGLGTRHSQALSLAQDVNALFLVVFFSVTSSSYVHRLHLLWKKSPFVNKQWTYSVLIIIVMSVGGEVYLSSWRWFLSHNEYARFSSMTFKACIKSVESLSLQLVYFVVSQALWNATTDARYSVTDLPPSVIIVFVLWPVVSIGISELIKRRYIKFWIRYQKRAKLQFGTKLGMNSPF